MAGERTFDVYWNVINRIHYDSTGTGLNRGLHPYVSFRENPIMTLHLVTDSDLTVYSAFDGAAGWQASTDSDFDAATGVMTKTVNANITKTGSGVWTIPLNADNTDYQTKISTNEELRDTQFEFQSLDGSGVVIGAIRMPFRCFGIIDDNNSVPPGISYPGYMEIDGSPSGKCLQIKNSEGVVLSTHCPPGVTC